MLESTAVGKGGEKWVVRTRIGSVEGFGVFQGKFEHTLDDKGRIALPSPLRRRLSAINDLADEENCGEVSIIITISDQCLAAYPQKEWDTKLIQLTKLNQFDPQVMAFKRIFVGCAQECVLDKAGRILVPSDLRRDVGLERDCVILGQMEKIEIWSKERWLQFFPQASDQMGAICHGMAERGIQI